MRLTRPFAVLLLCAVLAACGQTGPLYFDEAPPADQLPPSRKAPPASVAQPAATGDAPAASPTEEDTGKK